MFGFIFRKAQATVDNAIGQLMYGALIAVPLVVALGFGTAALSIRLERSYDAETSNLILAGAYLALAFLGWIAFATRSGNGQTPEIEGAAAEAEAAEEESPVAAFANISPADRELLVTALTTAGPVALPLLLRTIFRNLPIILFILAAAFVLTRDSAGEASETASAEGTAAEGLAGET